MSAYRYLHWDVFTDRRFTGNQLAVFIDAAGLDPDLVLLAIEVSVIGWLAQNYTTTQPLMVVGAFVTVVAIGLGIVWVNRTAFRRMRQLRDL